MDESVDGVFTSNMIEHTPRPMAVFDEIERFLGSRVFLDLTVKVRKGWRRDDGLLDRIGIDA